jgi:protease-4
MYGQFVQAVADGRHTKVEDIKPIADGRVWTGEQALGMHLIDGIGDFRAVVKETAKAVQISGEPTLVHAEKQRKSLLDLVFGDVTPWLPTKEKLLDEQMGFYYLWK